MMMKQFGHIHLQLHRSLHHLYGFPLIRRHNFPTRMQISRDILRKRPCSPLQCTRYCHPLHHQLPLFCWPREHHFRALVSWIKQLSLSIYQLLLPIPRPNISVVSFPLSFIRHLSHLYPQEIYARMTVTMNCYFSPPRSQFERYPH